MGPRTPAFVSVVVASVVLGSAWAGAQEQAVDVRDDSFAPATVTVAVGDTVTWTQSGSNPHSVTAADGSFDSHPACPGECMGQGDSFSQTFDSAGEVDYFCKIHGAAGQGMAGTVVVQAAADDPAPDDPQEEPDSEEPVPGAGDEPETTDEPGDEPATTDGSADTGAADDSAARTEQAADGTATADEGGQLADTGGPWALLPLGLLLLITGAVAVRRGRFGAV